MPRERTKPDINVTPLVDVVLVLLIIFMVVAPQMEAGAAVELPRVQNFDRHTNAAAPTLTLTLTTAGDIFVERELVTLALAKERLSTVHANEPEKRVIVKADHNVPYRDVKAFFAVCQDIGFPGVSMQVNEHKERL